MNDEKAIKMDTALPREVDTSAGQDACWPWAGPRFRTGYGRIGHHGYAHRVVYVLAHGAIPSGNVVRHTCDNPPCCNPAHLVAGTHADNMADMVARGRQCRGARKAAIMRGCAARGDAHGFRRHPEACARGERQGHAKLTAAQVNEIRAAWARGGVTQRALGALFGVTQGTVGDILHGRTWATSAAGVAS